MSAAEQRVNLSARSDRSPQEYDILARNFQKLRAALQAEQEKSAKLRRYIARINQSSGLKTSLDQPASTNEKNTASLQRLIQEQGALLDKLYNENQQQQSTIERVTRLNRQLLVANDKLRQALLGFKQRFKSKMPSPRDSEPLSQRLRKEEQRLPVEQIECADHNPKPSPFGELLKELKNGFCKA